MSEVKSNYEMFLDVVNDLKTSQGLYSRLARQLDEMTPEEIENVKNGLNNMPQWKDSVDVILFLES